MRGLRHFVIAVALVGLASPLVAQVGVSPNTPSPAVVQPASPPATRLESFRPEAGSIVTVGYEGLGGIARARVVVEVRDVRDSKGNSAGGVTVHLTESQTREERAFIDVDELPGLLKNLDALLEQALQKLNMAGYSHSPELR